MKIFNKSNVSSQCICESSGKPEEQLTTEEQWQQEVERMIDEEYQKIWSIR